MCISNKSPGDADTAGGWCGVGGHTLRTTGLRNRKLAVIPNKKSRAVVLKCDCTI